MSTILQSEYLYNDSGSHDKVYNVAIKEDLGAVYRYQVVTEWGPRLSVLKTTVKYTGNSLIEARMLFRKIVSLQTSTMKGYRVVSQSASNRTVLTDVPINNQPSSPPKKPTPITSEPETYNNEYVSERRLDIDL